MGSVGNTMLHEPLVTDDAGSTDFCLIGRLLVDRRFA
jgi:hypothetical protein